MPGSSSVCYHQTDAPAHMHWQHLRSIDMRSAHLCVPDVDDLTEGKGAEFVDASAATLIFVSAG